MVRTFPIMLGEAHFMVRTFPIMLEESRTMIRTSPSIGGNLPGRAAGWQNGSAGTIPADLYIKGDKKQMIEAQKIVADYCGRLREAVQDAELPETLTGRIAPLAEEARERELVVPVIGAFSAGKSSMINTLIGRE
ncbi:MAG: hypothetical protein LBG73_06505, partial [Spirochaetaceae bacterium]|nr:hypothetical protein [Spirochaetaceae bacterium]